MAKNEINTVEMVRAIRDRMYEETKGMSRDQFLEYIRRKAARVLGEDTADNTKSTRPAA
jgi:uncharacterized secreted protein with C-terminal beta-propeller domain